MAVKIQSFEKYEVEQSCRRLADGFGWDVSFQHGAVQFSAGVYKSRPYELGMAICSFASVVDNLLYVRTHGIVKWLTCERNAGALLEVPYLTPKEVTKAFKIDSWVSGGVGVVAADMKFGYDGVARITINVIEETTIVSMVRPATDWATIKIGVRA